jgi:hypothetical protein
MRSLLVILRKLNTATKISRLGRSPIVIEMRASSLKSASTPRILTLSFIVARATQSLPS